MPDLWITPTPTNVCPECVQGKHANCDGTALDEDRDDIVTCGCSIRDHEVQP